MPSGRNGISKKYSLKNAQWKKPSVRNVDTGK